MMIRAVLAAALALTGGCGGDAFTSAAPAADVVEPVDAGGALDARDLRATETAAAGSDDAALPDRQSDDAAAVFDVRADVVDVVDAGADVVDELDAGDAGDVAPWVECAASGCPACPIAGELRCCKSSTSCGCSSFGVCR